LDSLTPKDTEAERRKYPTTLFKHCKAEDKVFVPSKVSEKYNLCENHVSRMFRKNPAFMRAICEIYYLSSIVWEPPMGNFGNGPLVEVSATFAVKGTNGVEIDERKKGKFMSSSLAAIHGLLTTLDEVIDLLKMTSSVGLNKVADLSKTTSIENEEEREETHSPIADSLTTSSENEEEREETHSPIADNFIFTDRLPGHLDKDFMTKVKSLRNDPEIQRRLHEYLDRCYEMNTFYKKAIKAVLTDNNLHVDGKYIRFYYCIHLIIMSLTSNCTNFLQYHSNVGVWIFSFSFS